MCALKKINFSYMLTQRRILFLKNILTVCNSNKTLMGICNTYVHNNEFQTLLMKGRVNVQWSVTRIKTVIFSDFVSSCT